MYPSYKDLADKKAKLQEYYDQIKLDKKIDAIKQKAYETAIWSSDVASNVILPKPQMSSNIGRTIEIQTDSSNPRTIEVQTESNGRTIQTQTKRNTKARSAQTEPMGITTGTQYESNPRYEPRIKTRDQIKLENMPPVETRNRFRILSDEDDEESKPIFPAEDNKKTPREQIIKLYKDNWNFFKTRKISPILLNGDEDKSVYLGRSGRLFTIRSDHENKNKRIIDYDWVATKEKIDKIIDENRRVNGIRQGVTQMSIKSEPDIKMEGQGFKLIARKKLIGRGLIGAGISHLHNFEKDYLYRPLGAKYVNLKALGQGYLSLRHPSGNSCFKRLKMSDKLLQIIKILLFDGVIDYSLYNQLDNKDKIAFYDTLKVCKLLNSFKETISDPRDGSDKYVAEFNKLIGEIKIGNDNPLIKSELKKMSIHLFQNGILSDKQFNDILMMTI